MGQYFALENIEGEVDANEQPRIKHYRGRREPAACNPCGRKGQERHHEEMDEVNPYQSQRRTTYEPHQVIVVYPNDGNEQVAYGVTDGRWPQRPERRESRLIRRFQLQYHDGHDYREERV